ncbi:response regulator [Halobacteriovorax sp.]|uniref:response regulator n=1 Tax=Halobacteriovorax sp. TaxID=2020862 RepID=UPI0035693D2B
MRTNTHMNILIVDDDDDVINYMRTLLRKNGYKNIHTEKDGVRAVDYVEQSYMENKTIDMILADWEMPELDGIHFLDYLKRNADFNEIPFVMVTADSDRTHVVEAINHGVSQYLIKPFDEKKLISKINEVMKRKSA